MQVPDVHPGPVCGAGLLPGLLPLRPQQQEQTSCVVDVVGVQGPGPQVQEESEGPLSRPSHQFHSRCLQYLQACH